MISKTDYPADSELVLCTVTKIYPHCVFVNIDDYHNKQGMIHISEISPGRIRNIHDYVRMGKTIICKVLSVNRKKGHIDLSLRRVSESQRREKAELIKKDQKAAKIIEFLAEKLKLDKKKLLNDISQQTSEYPSIHDFFEDFIMDASVIQELKLPKNVIDELSEIVRQRVKMPEVEIDAELTIKSYFGNGVEVIKKILTKAADIEPTVKIYYKGGGTYGLSIKHADYKGAEQILKTVTDVIQEDSNKNDCEFAFKRVDKKQKKAAV